MEYPEKVATKTALLERKSIAVREGIKATRRERIRLQMQTETEMASLHAEMAALEEEVSGVRKRLENVIVSFRSVARKDDLQRIQRKSDVWAPEQLVSQPEFDKMLRKD